MFSASLADGVTSTDAMEREEPLTQVGAREFWPGVNIRNKIYLNQFSYCIQSEHSGNPSQEQHGWRRETCIQREGISCYGRRQY